MHALVLLLLLVSASTASAQWSRVDEDLPQSNIFLVGSVVASDEAVHVTAGFNPRRVYRSTDHGDSWTLVEAIERADGLYNAEATVVAHLPGSVLYISVDEGETWTTRSAESAPLTGYFGGLARVEADGRSHAFIAGANPARLYVTHDDFATTELRLPEEGIQRVVSNGRVLLAANGTAQDAAYFRSEDGGRTWSTSTPSGLASQYLYPSNDSFFVAGIDPATAQRVLLVSADGQAWAQVGTGVALTIAPALASSARHASVVTYAMGTNFRGNFFASGQSGRHQQAITDDYPVARIGTIIIGPCTPTGALVATSSQYAYALAQCDGEGNTVSNALYRRSLEDVTSTATVAEALPTLHLDAPAPHPVRGTARVTYETATAGTATLVLYDVLGREVKRLASGIHKAGAHTAALDADALAPGVYVLRLTTEQGAASRLVTVVR